MFTAKSTVDNRKYIVVNSKENFKDAANLLARINNANQTVIKYMVKKYKNTPHEIRVNRLDNKYNPDTLGEHIPPGKNNTSYVVDKGKQIRFCLRPNTDRGTLHDFNILMFVSLHEISHIMNLTIGHEPDFWQNFKFILKNAVEAGVYKPVNYMKNPVLYCNLTVNYNPLYDEQLAYVK